MTTTTTLQRPDRRAALVLGLILAAAGLGGCASPSADPPTAAAAHEPEGRTAQHVWQGSQLIVTQLPGWIMWQFTPAGAPGYAAVFGSGFPPGATLVAAGVSESAASQAVARAVAVPGAIVQVTTEGGAVIGTTGTATSAGTGAGAGGALLTTAGIVAGAFVVAAVTVIAIDCYQAGECIWTTVNDAGGLGRVLGTSPNPTAAPIPGAVTVSCFDPRSLEAQCTASSLRNVITSYYSWFGGSYWTCGAVWDSGSTSTDPAWLAARAACGAERDRCVASTRAVCDTQEPDSGAPADAGTPPTSASDASAVGTDAFGLR